MAIQSHNLLVIGQSHVAAVRAAARLNREAFPDQPRTRVIHTLEPVHAPEMDDVGGDDPGRGRFGPKLREAIADQIARHDPRIASVIGGNAHNMLALLRHPRPFDFRLRDGERPPPDPGAEMIPLALVRAALERRMQPDFARLHALREVAGPFIQIESPPPLRDERYIADRAEAWFRERSHGPIQVAGAGVRWRMWRLASDLMRAATLALGGRYLHVPAEIADAAGFLGIDYAADPTHGNAAYGAALIRRLDSL